MFSKVGKDNYGWAVGIIVTLVVIGIIISLVIYLAYFMAIAGSFAGGGLAVFNYGKSFKKNIIDENFSSAR